MPKIKIPRKSTFIDMTAMCDVAFLLLSFFILTTKFKPSEAVTVTPPSSVSSKAAPEKDVVLVTIDNKGKVFLSFSEEDKKAEVLQKVGEAKGLQFSPAEIKTFQKAPFVGLPFSQLRFFLQQTPEAMASMKMPGIPAQDTINNELTDWIGAALTVYQGKKMNLLVKGDMDAKYPAFKGVLVAFKKNEQFKFQMVTNTESIPEGTDLWKNNNAGNKVE
ncbi:MAG TPA: biopolymer transporter ExbD [Chitinophagaceae bacterium]|mgnify:CR=1 FL=1|nr:biopolymer transporter ExbD [Chitinophagaceae bacterium]